MFVTANDGHSHFKHAADEADTRKAKRGISDESKARVVHASREVPCTAFGEDSIKPSAGKLRETRRTAACRHLVGLKAPVKLIVSLRTDNDDVRAVAKRSWGHRFGPESYIAMAARTLPRCGADTFSVPEMLGEAGLVIM